MIDTILFDLDGTLLQFAQEDFIMEYFSKLGNVFASLGLDAEAGKKAVWTGTKAMVANDGSVLNRDCFWAVFSKILGLPDDRRGEVEAACNDFYVSDFDSLKSLLAESAVSRRLIPMVKAKGLDVVLATNPLFPLCAVETRLRWIGLATTDFLLVTHYGNSSFCKPNLAYYQEIFHKIGKEPANCLMIGNNPLEDMRAGELGAKTYLVTNFLEDATSVDISAYENGTLNELEVYLRAL